MEKIIEELLQREGSISAKRIDSIHFPFLKKLTMKEYQEFRDILSKQRQGILESVSEKGSGMALLYGMRVMESPRVPEGEIWIEKK